MRELDEILDELREVAAHPRKQLEKALKSGRKVVGILPYFAPEELVYAAGALPMGLWGADMVCYESRRYFPSFICSVLHSSLELGITGKLDGLSGVLIPISCDGLKGMVANWTYGVPQIPAIQVAFAENRTLSAGEIFTASQFHKVRRQLETLLETEISDHAITQAVDVYNENRAALREFVSLAGEKPGLILPSARTAVIKAGNFMDREAHTAILRELNAALRAAPAPEFHGLRVVLSGITADDPGFLKASDHFGLSVAADQLADETVSFSVDTPVTADPINGMAERLGKIEGASVLFDPNKRRCSELAETAARVGADGVIFISTKFCDPEEFDFPPVKRALSARNIPLLQIETDRQTDASGRIFSAVEAFCETF